MSGCRLRCGRSDVRAWSGRSRGSGSSAGTLPRAAPGPLRSARCADRGQGERRSEQSARRKARTAAPPAPCHSPPVYVGHRRTCRKIRHFGRIGCRGLSRRAFRGMTRRECWGEGNGFGFRPRSQRSRSSPSRRPGRRCRAAGSKDNTAAPTGSSLWISGTRSRQLPGSLSRGRIPGHDRRRLLHVADLRPRLCGSDRRHHLLHWTGDFTADVEPGGIVDGGHRQPLFHLPPPAAHRRRHGPLRAHGGG